MQEHLTTTNVRHLEEALMNQAPRNNHDFAYYIGLNAALLALIFVSLLAAGVI